MLSWRYLKARWMLAWALCKHLLLRLVYRRAPRRWVDHMRQEALAPTAAVTWTLLANSSRCVQCGLCEAVTPPHVRPAAWIAGSLRRAQDTPLALEQAALLRQHAAAIAAVCPTGVDARGVAELIEAQAGMLNPTGWQLPQR